MPIPAQARRVRGSAATFSSVREVAVHFRAAGSRMTSVLLFGLGAVPSGAAAQQPDPTAHYVPTAPEVVHQMLAFAHVSKDDIVYDLGSGDGRIVIMAAERFGARGVGIEIDPALIRESVQNAAAAGVAGRVRFRQEDLFQADVAEATVVTIFLLPALNLRLRPKLLTELRPGTRIVAQTFELGDWKPDTVVQMRRNDGGEASLFYWVVPAHVAGTWSLAVAAPETGANGPASQAGESARRQPRYIVSIEQEYQRISGSARAGPRALPLDDAELTGDRITFTLTDRVDGRPVHLRFTGLVTDDAMAGSIAPGQSASGRSWTGTRISR